MATKSKAKTEDLDRIHLEFDAALFARGWLSVDQAASRDEARVALYRAVSIEVHPGGVLLAATDGYVFLRSWVPTAFGDEDDPVTMPPIDAAPLRTVVARDVHGRASSLLAYALAQATAKDAPPMEVILEIGPGRLSDEDSPQLHGMDAECVAFEFKGTERVELGIFDAPWITWRKLLDGFVPEETGAIALNPEVVGRLVKLGKYHANKPLVWGFGGPDRVATIAVRASFPMVDGLAMPVRLTPEEFEKAGEPTTSEEAPDRQTSIDDNPGAEVLKNGAGVITSKDDVDAEYERLRDAIRDDGDEPPEETSA